MEYPIKKIINGKLYSTETAKEVGNWDNGCSQSDFGYTEETLYQKKTGEFFLYGKGGAMSCYSRCVYGSTWMAGDSIIPLSPEEAKEWAVKHMDADAYMEVFGIVEE